MVTKLQHDIAETDGVDGYSDARISDLSPDDSDSIAASKDEHFDTSDAPVMVKSTQCAQRSARPVRSSTPPLRPEDGFIGLKVTNAPPHAVIQVDDLVDVNFVRHDAAGYSNPAITPGDRILKVDDMFAEHVSVETLHSLLMGELNTPVKISLARATGEEYSIKVIRHHFHAFHPPDEEGEDAPVFVKEGRHAVTRAAAPLKRAAPPPTRAHPPPKPVSNSNVPIPSAEKKDQPSEEKPRKAVPINILVLAVTLFLGSAIFAVLLLGSVFSAHGDHYFFSSPSLAATLKPAPSYFEVSEPMAAASLAAAATVAATAAAEAAVRVAATAKALEADAREEVEEPAGEDETREKPEDRVLEQGAGQEVDESPVDEAAMGEPEDTKVQASEELNEPVVNETVRGKPEETSGEREDTSVEEKAGDDVNEPVVDEMVRGEPEETAGEETAREEEPHDTTAEEATRKSSAGSGVSWNHVGEDPEL